MFEQFDDPEPFTPTPSMQVKVTAAGRHRRRRRRCLITGAVTLAVLGVLAAPVIYLRLQAAELDRVEVAGLVPPTPPTPPTPAEGSEPAAVEEPPPALAAPLNILVVGVDTRPEGDAVSGSRTDTIAVVRIDPAGPDLTVLSIPRDLYVPIDGGGENRINSALSRGRDALVATVSETLDVDINHYVEIDFAGFSRLVDLAGGVDVAFDAPVRDRNTGFAADAGCVHLDGDRALAYVRSRRLQTYDPASGRWEADPSSDLGRIARQQDFGVRVVEQVLGSSYGRTDQLRIVTDVLDDVTVDEGLTVDGLRAIWNTAADAGAERTTLLTLNDVVRARNVDGAAVLDADLDAVRAIAAPLRGASPVGGDAEPDTPNLATEAVGSAPSTTAPAPGAACPAD